MQMLNRIDVDIEHDRLTTPNKQLGTLLPSLCDINPAIPATAMALEGRSVTATTARDLSSSVSFLWQWVV